MRNEKQGCRNNIPHSSLLISHLIIPNGKGKVGRFVSDEAVAALYQSPMGKVKNNILPYDFILHTTYRFVKRKFEFFV